MDHNRSNKRAADPQMDAPSKRPKQTRQISTGKQRLNEKERQRDDARKSGHDISRVTPSQQRAGRCYCDRHKNGGGKSGPDCRRTNPTHTFPADCIQAG